jgi:hypothetical protein
MPERTVFCSQQLLQCPCGSIVISRSTALMSPWLLIFLIARSLQHLIARYPPAVQGNFPPSSQQNNIALKFGGLFRRKT